MLLALRPNSAVGVASEPLPLPKARDVHSPLIILVYKDCIGVIDIIVSLNSQGQISVVLCFFFPEMVRLRQMECHGIERGWILSKSMDWL